MSDQSRRPRREFAPRISDNRLEDRISLSAAHFPPGQFPSGNPAHAPGESNPNENGGPKD